MSKLEDSLAFTDIKIKAIAQSSVGDDLFDIELSAVSLRFTENGIPKAILKIALGESPQPGGGIAIAGAHAKAKELENRTRIAVKAEFSGHQTPDKTWEQDGTFYLFWGYLSRPAYTMGTSAATLVLEVDHWLSNLATTSKFSYILQANSAAHNTRAVITKSFTGGFVGIDGTKVAYSADAPENLWQTIKAVFGYLADQDRLNAGLIEALDLTNPEAVKNTLALEALKFMDNGKTLPMKFIGDDETIRDRVRESLADIIAAKDTGGSYWETLLTLCREFMFSVVPTIATATCVPVIKTINKSLLRISASEYFQIAPHSDIPVLPVRSVGLYSSCVWFTLDTRGMSQTEYLSDPVLIGYWDLAKDHSGDPQITAGQLMVTNAPSWMHNAGNIFSACTYKNTPSFRAIKTLANAKVKREEQDKRQPNEAQNETVDKNNPNRVGNRLAQAILADVSWKHRVGSIAGRLRFDIAPGSPIELETVGKNVPFYQQSGNNTMYAHVYQVDIEIDATAPKAFTTLHLSHMRTEAEQKKFSSIVIDEHPLYGNAWDGTSLLDGMGS